MYYTYICTTGDPGQTGPKGDHGIKGDTGQRGDSGDRGPRGLIGQAMSKYVCMYV